MQDNSFSQRRLRRKLWRKMSPLLPCLFSFLAESSILKIEGTHVSETSVKFRRQWDVKSQKVDTNCRNTLLKYTAERPPLWSSDQSSWLQIRGPEFDSRRYQIFWEVVGLERSPLSFVSKIEEVLGRNSSGSCLENREYGRGDPLRWPRDTLYPQKLGTNFADKRRSLDRSL
jgi:hypothetical protein